MSAETPMLARGDSLSADASAGHVTRRRIAADQIVRLSRRPDAATDPRRGWPDDLRIMPDVGPIARSADVRENPGLEHPLAGSPLGNHPFGREIAPGALPEILPLPQALMHGRMAPTTGASEFGCVNIGSRREAGIPHQLRSPDVTTLQIVRLKHLRGKRRRDGAGRRCRTAHKQQRQRSHSIESHLRIHPPAPTNREYESMRVNESA